MIHTGSHQTGPSMRYLHPLTSRCFYPTDLCCGWSLKSFHVDCGPRCLFRGTYAENSLLVTPVKAEKHLRWKKSTLSASDQHRPPWSVSRGSRSPREENVTSSITTAAPASWLTCSSKSPPQILTSSSARTEPGPPGDVLTFFIPTLLPIHNMTHMTVLGQRNDRGMWQLT